MIGSTNKIEKYLDELFPNPKCELNYNKDYELLIATMLSAQTTDKRVNMVTEILFKKYPTTKDLSKADINDIIEIIKPIGTFNKKAKNIIEISKKLTKDYNGKVPNDRKYLENLPGVGRKTTNVVLSNLFNEPCIAVDTHVSRVSKRLALADKKDDVKIIEKKLTKIFSKQNLCKIHHQLVLFGRYHCQARNPKCQECKLQDICKNIKKEKSCGAIIYRKNKELEFLIIKHNKGHYSFPKGHVEKNETEIETALREIKEETNLQVKINDNFKYKATYMPKEKTIKDVIYFLATNPKGIEKPQEEEIQSLNWYSKEDALKIITYDNDKKILKEAIKFIEK